MGRQGVGEVACAVAGLGRPTGQEQGERIQRDEGQAGARGKLTTTNFRHAFPPF